MTPEERSLLERTHKLAEENNKILHSLQRSNRFAIALKIAYWVVIVAISVGSFFIVQKFIDMIPSFFGQVQGGLQSSGNSSASSNTQLISTLENLLKNK